MRRLLRKIRPASLAARIKKWIGIRRKVVETRLGRFYVDPVSHVGGDLIEFGEYEPDMKRTIDQYLPDEGIFVDAGANEGYFSVIAARRAARVLACEPQSRLQEVIARNLALNGVEDRVELLPIALGAAEGEISIRLTPDLNTGASGFSNVTRYALPSEVVRVRSLTDVVREHEIPRIDLLKVDIEGAEHLLLQGAETLLAAGIVRHIALELHERQLHALGSSPEAVLDLLSRHGYTAIPGAPTFVLAKGPKAP